MSIINVIGLGYIGLPTALMFAKSGFKVVGTDIKEDVVESLNNKTISFEEKGLEELYLKVKEDIKFTTEYKPTDIYIISVPTPFNKNSGKLNSDYILSAVRSILDVCKPNSKLIIESTVSPGTIDKLVRQEIESHNLVIGKDIHLVHAPERIIPGNMIYELENNSRTIGADNLNIGEEVKKMYAEFCEGEIIITDILSAEMSKVVENTFRDINIAFANELAKICHYDNMNVYEIIKIANMHPRVNVMQPGPGVGGHCIPVDPCFLIGDYPERTNLISVAREVNDSMPNHVLTRIKEIMDKHNILNFSKVGLYGLSYKENVDDTRESPTIQLLNNNKSVSKEIKTYDPLVKRHIGYNQYFNFSDFLNDVEIVVVMVSHHHLVKHNELLKNKIVLDCKNTYLLEASYKL